MSFIAINWNELFPMIVVFLMVVALAFGLERSFRAHPFMW